MLLTKGTKGHINKLTRIQRQAALSIMGAMPTMANNTLDAHANLLLFHLLISRIICRATTRLACIPDVHPLASKVWKAATWYIKRHRTPLHEIIHMYDLKPSQMEKIEAVVLGLKWQPAYRTHVASNKEQAIEEVETDEVDEKVFTDGSCRDGDVGAAAVLYRGGTEKQVVKLYMGTEDEHTMFEAKLAAATIGAKLLNAERGTRFTIVLDNQAAIQTTRK